MVNVKKEKSAELSGQIHSAICRRARQLGAVKEDIVIENRVIEILCDDCEIQPSKCAVKLNDRFSYDLTGDDIISIFRSRRMGIPRERTELFEWAGRVAELFGRAVIGDRKAFDEFEVVRKEKALKSGKHHDSQERICSVMIANRYPDLITDEDYDVIERAGNTMGKYIFYDIADAVSEVFGFPSYKDQKKTGISDITESKITLEQAVKRINSLENELESTSSMLSDLQNEFEDQLSESKIKELTDFFAKLNSEKYGCILDQLLELSKGVNELRKNGIKVPIEINGALIVIKKLIQFVRDSHIDPVLKPDSEIVVKASDVEYCNYSGTPFCNESEEKIIRVLSPGWIYRDKEIQISRPRVEEV